MAFDYLSARDGADELLNEFGMPVVLIRNTVPVATSTGVFINNNTSRVPGVSTTAVGSLTMLLSGSIESPEVGDELLVDDGNGNQYYIESVDAVKPSTTTLLYRVNLL